jgi:hypothetical protein
MAVYAVAARCAIAWREKYVAHGLKLVNDSMFPIEDGPNWGEPRRLHSTSFRNCLETCSFDATTEPLNGALSVLGRDVL